MDAATLANTICDSPARVATVAGPAPLYGTCTMSIFAIDFNSSPARCGVLPTPDDAYLIAPGLALASSMNSLIEVAGTEGCTTTMYWPSESCVSGCRSCCTLTGRFG